MTEVGDEARDVDVGRTRAVAGRCVDVQAGPFGAGLAPDMAFPLLAVVAQRAAQRPGGRQPPRRQLERHFIEGGEVGGLTAAEGDLDREARGARQQTAHLCRLAFGEEPVAIERAPRLLDDAHALGHHHQAGRRGDDVRGRERQRRA